MKKFFLFFTVSIITALSIISCSRDDDKPADNSWVYGKWNVTHYSESANGTYNDMTILGYYAQFNSDGSYKSYSGSNYSGTYTVNGNTIKAKVGSETVVYDVLERSGNNAKAKMYYESDPTDIVYFKLVKQ
ncbi:hypothetical protein [Daejeonia sp. YH14]|uniref:hypothetical protein n=1 Tax=Daejeonia sp. YH14 TaxID=3439042 RepID=UPI003F493E5D